MIQGEMSDPSADWLDLPSFAKIMIGDFDIRMKIPTAFLKHIRGEYPRLFRLSVSDNGHWAVHACKARGKVHLEQGWNEFVRDNELREADFLVFHYRGDAGFRVTVFGRHCCLRRREAVGKFCGASSLDREWEEEEIIEIDSDETSEDEDSDLDYDSTEDDSDSSEDDYERPRAPIRRRRKRNIAEIRLKKKASHVSSPRRISQRTNFRIIMRKTYIRKRYLSVPVAMIGHLLGSEEEYVKLVVGNKMWEVKLNVYEEAYKLGAGWPAFVSDNNLKVGDVCNFEVTKHGREVWLLVTIRRKGFRQYY